MYEHQLTINGRVIMKPLSIEDQAIEDQAIEDQANISTR